MPASQVSDRGGRCTIKLMELHCQVKNLLVKSNMAPKYSSISLPSRLWVKTSVESGQLKGKNSALETTAKRKASTRGRQT